MIRFGQKEERDHCKVMLEKKPHWNLKHQMRDPTILHVCQLNIFYAETGQNFELKDKLWKYSKASFNQG